MKRISISVFNTSMLASIATTCFLFLLSGRSSAQGLLPACPKSGTATQAELQTNFLNGCSSTPDQYEVTFFDIGMCTSSPITGTSFDPSSCVQIFSNPAGQRVNLANQANQGESIRLGSFELIPGQYTHFYVVISNRFGIKGEYTMTDAGTWYTDGRDPDDAPGFNNAKAASPAIAFENLISNFGGGDNDPCKTVDAFSLEGGNIETLLVNEALQVTCQGSSKIVASFIPSTPLAIPEISPESAPRIDVAFTITNNGLVVLPNDPPAPGILGFGGGGFFPQFRLLN